MSRLSQFFSGGGGIASIQQGVQFCAASGTTPVAITAVDVLKAHPIHNGMTNGVEAYLVLASPTLLNIVNTSGVAGNVSWGVKEYS